MKTIIQIVQHLKPGGIETMALDLHSYNQSKGHRCYIISLEGQQSKALQTWPRLEPFLNGIIFLNKPQKFSVKFIIELTLLLKKLGTDVLHTHHIGPLLYGGLAGLFSQPNVHIHTEHDAWHLHNPKHCRLQKWLLKIIKPVLVADALAVAGALQNFLQPENLHIIHNGIDTDIFIPGDQYKARQQLNLPQHKTIIGCSGRLESLKGQQVLIQSLRRLPNHIHIVLAGTGSYEKQLRKAALSSGLQQRIHFLGSIDNMSVFYQSLDLFCLPSFKEGMPLSPLEAQACGIPSIITDVGGSKEALCPDTGTLIPAGSEPAITTAIKKLLKQPFIKSPREFVKQQGDIHKMASAYAELHQS